MRPLTKRQQEVLEVIQWHVKEHGFTPTREELAKAMGYKSANNVTCHLDALVKKHRITITPYIPRGICINGV